MTGTTICDHWSVRSHRGAELTVAGALQGAISATLWQLSLQRSMRVSTYESWWRSCKASHAVTDGELPSPATSIYVSHTSVCRTDVNATMYRAGPVGVSSGCARPQQSRSTSGHRIGAGLAHESSGRRSRARDVGTTKYSLRARGPRLFFSFSRIGGLGADRCEFKKKETQDFAENSRRGGARRGHQTAAFRT